MIFSLSRSARRGQKEVSSALAQSARELTVLDTEGEVAESVGRSLELNVAFNALLFDKVSARLRTS
jgi:hypothetical protein